LPSDTGAKDRKPALELVRRAEITQATGEDWSDVALSVSTVRTALGGKAPELNPLVVQYPHVAQAQAPAPASVPGDALRALPLQAGKERSALADQAVEKKAVAEVSGFQVLFRIPGRVSVGASEGAKSLYISAAAIAPDLVVRSVPVIDPTAFLEASFIQSEDAPLLPGRMSVYRDGVFVGRGQMAAANKEEKVRLGFGADDKIKIVRSVVKRNEGSAGLIVTTAKTENDDIQVEMLSSSTPPTTTNLRDKRGVLEWAVEVAPAESREISFAWRVRWPKDKGVVMIPSG
jgi:uncharacterized protein (TIGR02231 family)